VDDCGVGVGIQLFGMHLPYVSVGFDEGSGVGGHGTLPPKGARARNNKLACRNSFDPDTPVLMADGTQRAIKDVQVGDEVEATDPATDQTTDRVVTALHRNTDTQLTDLTLVGGPSSRSILHTTAEHPFYNASTDAWTDAGRLVVGDHLYTADGQSITVAEVRTFTGSTTMYNLTVAVDHTYYVLAGTTPVLVHNCGELNFTGSGINDAMQDQIQTLVDIYDANGGRLPDYIARGGGPNHIWENRRNQLPSKSYGYYTEADVWALKPDPTGTYAGRFDLDRLIFGKGGEVYYTPDHYRQIFIKLR